MGNIAQNQMLRAIRADKTQSKWRPSLSKYYPSGNINIHDCSKRMGVLYESLTIMWANDQVQLGKNWLENITIDIIIRDINSRVILCCDGSIINLIDIFYRGKTHNSSDINIL